MGEGRGRPHRESSTYAIQEREEGERDIQLCILI